MRLSPPCYCSLLIATLFLVGLPSFAGADQRVETETFEVDADVRVRLDAFKGKIHVRTSDVDRVELIATIYPDDGPVEDLELVEIETSASRSSVRIDVEYDRELTDRNDSSWFGSNNSVSLPFVDIEIVMPDQGSLYIDSHKSRFDIEAPAGEVVIDSHKGEGTVDNVRGDFELDTHKGVFDVEILELHYVQIDTHKGDVDLVVDDNDDFRVRAETHKGRLRFRGRDIPMETDDDGEHTVSHTIGSGSSLIDLDTHKGSISIDFQR